MNPQGSTIVDTSYFDALVAQVEACNECAALQAISARATASLDAVKEAIAAQMAALGPIAALLSPPSSPTDVVTWVGDFITVVLTPMYQPYLTQVDQLAALATQIPRLAAAISAAAARIGDCPVAPPTP